MARQETATHRRILNILGKFDAATDETLVVEFHRKHGRVAATDSSVRTRRAELVQMGKIEYAGSRAKSLSGATAKQWRVVK